MWQWHHRVTGASEGGCVSPWHIVVVHLPHYLSICMQAKQQTATLLMIKCPICPSIWKSTMHWKSIQLSIQSISWATKCINVLALEALEVLGGISNWDLLKQIKSKRSGVMWSHVWRTPTWLCDNILIHVGWYFVVHIILCTPHELWWWSNISDLNNWGPEYGGMDQMWESM